MKEKIHEEYLFVVDTESYSGNFHRELVAYMTGQYSEYSLGDVIVEEMMTDETYDYLENTFDGKIRWINDGEHDTDPSEVFENPSFFNDGHGHYYPIEHLEQEEWRDTRVFPAYLSVAIRLTETPTSEILNLLVVRANEFFDQYVRGNEAFPLNSHVLPNKRVVVQGFRLLLEQTFRTELAVSQ